MASTAAHASPVRAENSTSPVSWNAQQPLALVRAQQVDLVSTHAGLAERIQLAQNLFHLRLLFLAVTRSGVADVQQHLGRATSSSVAGSCHQRVAAGCDESPPCPTAALAPAGQRESAQLGSNVANMRGD